MPSLPFNQAMPETARAIASLSARLSGEGPNITAPVEGEVALQGLAVE
jgi:hypothetical protein